MVPLSSRVLERVWGRRSLFLNSPMYIRPPTTMASVWLAVAASRMMQDRMTVVTRPPRLLVNIFSLSRKASRSPDFSMMAP